MVISLKRKRKYCEEHQIYIPSNANEKVINSAIANAFMHNKKIELKSCFGTWEDAVICSLCNFEEDCFVAKVGEGKKKWLSRIDKLDNPKYSFKTLSKKSKKRKK